MQYAKNKAWIAVELDGTLAEYNDQQPHQIGEPLARMLALVRGWLNDNKTVKIVTGRAKNPSELSRVNSWLNEHGLGGLEVIAWDDDMVCIWSSRAMRVEHNKGAICQGCDDAPVHAHSQRATKEGYLSPVFRSSDERRFLTDC
ncbi:hypothetical protein [Chitinimonas taiwanensis]|uniref:hypothetical protein n=1 Tax=Chitinimonas taiwanensis TaxID=240412 RepID=UPI0035ADE8B5